MSEPRQGGLNAQAPRRLRVPVKRLSTIGPDVMYHCGSPFALRIVNPTPRRADRSTAARLDLPGPAVSGDGQGPALAATGAGEDMGEDARVEVTAELALHVRRHRP